MLLKDIKAIYHKELDAHYAKEEVTSFFYLLVEHYLGWERFVLTIRPDIVVSKEQEQPFFEALSALRLHRPIQYIIGSTQFMDLDFFLNENVLIPRPETEELVRWVLEDVASTSPILGNQVTDKLEVGLSAIDLNQNSNAGELRLLDIGTGSGCIAVSLAKSLPRAEVHALDVSIAALELAERNAKEHRVDIKFTQADIAHLESLGRPFDIIISNPPYVRELEKAEMHKNVLDYEPALALFVSNEHPLVFYEHIVRFSCKNLIPGGSLYLEINQYLVKETRLLLEKHNFTDIELRKDMFGNDRMLKAKLF